ncbi:MAG: septum formation protein Maf [Nevskia sp.]|nr:septum formation protein Maf [Nevskia sp.]
MLTDPDRGPILASGSPYRAALLARLRLPFEVAVAPVDERPRPDEEPAALARRLAVAKARAVAAARPQRWVLGSDQVCACAGRVLGKPGTRAAARAQLAWLSGRRAEFFTAVALLRGEVCHEALDLTTVQFRALDESEIERYLDAEPALDCAGSFKSEGLGIALCAAIETRDPSALIGLPLIATAELLRRAGYRLP